MDYPVGDRRNLVSEAHMNRWARQAEMALWVLATLLAVFLVLAERNDILTLLPYVLVIAAPLLPWILRSWWMRRRARPAPPAPPGRRA